MLVKKPNSWFTSSWKSQNAKKMKKSGSPSFNVSSVRSQETEHNVPLNNSLIATISLANSFHNSWSKRKPESQIT